MVEQWQLFLTYHCYHYMTARKLHVHHYGSIGQPVEPVVGRDEITKTIMKTNKLK